MKGQSAIFEQVLLFAIAVAIFVACLGIFQIYQSHFNVVSTVDHIKAVRDTVYNNIVELTTIPSLNSSVTFDIPSEINGEGYNVKINNTELRVITDSGTAAAIIRLDSISSASPGGLYTFSGETASSKGEIIIYKRGYNIILD